MSVKRNLVLILYMAMLLATVAHMFEEVWGDFWIIDSFFGLGWFLVTNWLLLSIPFVFFFFIIIGKRWAYYLGFVYAIIMVLNGSGHIGTAIIRGSYSGGFAGAYSGIGLIITGLPLAYVLWISRPDK